VGVPIPWYALAILATLLNGSVLGFIAWRERDATLRHWAAAWIAWSVAVIPMAALESPDGQPLLSIFFGLLWVASSLLFLRGAYAFAGKPTPRAWYGVAGVCCAAAVALGVGPSGPAGMFPLVLFQSSGLIGTGTLLLRNAAGRAGAWLAGIAMIGLGLHLLDAPFFASRPEIFLWGFVLAIGLQIVAALGMLMLYYEHARARLLEAERALEDSRRIEALGRIAGGVAHDFNNMITVIRGHTELLRHSGAEAGSLDESLGAIEQAIERAQRLTAQLLAFGRRAIVQPAAIDVGAVIRETLDLLQKVIPENIRLSARVEERRYLASMDQSLLEQIVLNLVINARDAISGPGNVEVDLTELDGPRPSLVLRVVDDGVGMYDEFARHVFEPFFTSKPAGRGTGLGLASVQGAVSQLGGEIRVTSKVGVGSTFEVVLPWVTAEPVPVSRRRVKPGRALSILVVDDDESVRQTAAKMLESGGHRVEEASDGQTALERLRHDTFDVVLTDVRMPELGAAELADELSSRSPITSVILMSGYPQDDVPSAGKVHYLAKPFSREGLLDLVARVGSEVSGGRRRG
jgi:signal transduction histidine kinase